MTERIHVVILMRPIAFAAAQLNLALHDAAHIVSKPKG